jgi:hypothetical protein
MEKERNYYAKVAIVGQSGTGKSYLSKTADKETTGLINVERKPLPYKSMPLFKFEGRPKTWVAFIKNLNDYINNPEVKSIIIDSQTMALNILHNEMGKTFTGYDIYKNFNKAVYDYLETLKNAEKDIIVLSHDEILPIEGEKVKRMAVHGKEYEGKIEQHYSIVLYTGTRLKEGSPEYFLKTFEPGTSTKVPEGLFPDKNGITLKEIKNDSGYIFEELKNYYSK